MRRPALETFMLELAGWLGLNQQASAVRTSNLQIGVAEMQLRHAKPLAKLHLGIRDSVLDNSWCVETVWIN